MGVSEQGTTPGKDTRATGEFLFTLPGGRYLEKMFSKSVQN